MSRNRRSLLLAVLSLLCFTSWAGRAAVAVDCPSGSIPAFEGSDDCILNPAAIPKYVTPLVIPPLMKTTGSPDNYAIAVRQFRQQILPGGIWNTLNNRSDSYPPTTVWSYGPASDPVPDSSALGGAPGVAPAPNSQFNYPAFTIETTSGRPVNVRWINDLKDPATGNCLPHLLPVDQTLHWANPPMDCMEGDARTDCMGRNPAPYTGPVPIVPHVHGAHVEPHSDGYPEAWWLPKCNVPAGYATRGALFDDATGTNAGNLGYADYLYRNDQPATTLWYHDHALGLTRNNVYAGPAGFWLIRGGANDRADNIRTPASWDGTLPAPAARAGNTLLQLNLPDHPVRTAIREIALAIQDRSFKPDGELFYPTGRAFFEGVSRDDLRIPFMPEGNSDISPIWNPEAFFRTMVVNGTTWPYLDVAPALYRFRLLNGCNSRFLWLKFNDPRVKVHQIGAEQGFLGTPVDMNALDLDGSGDGKAQILMGLAERADVLVDFRGLPDGAEVELLNIGPDEPFGGGVPCQPEGPSTCDFAPADPETTGKVMKFVVRSGLRKFRDFLSTSPANLALNAEGPLGPAAARRSVSLKEEESATVCVLADEQTGSFVVPIEQVSCDDPPPDGFEVVRFAPKAALLGTVENAGGDNPTGIPLKWADTRGTNVTVRKTDGTPVTVNVTEIPRLGDTEEWDIYNFTVDAHPIHLHLVRFEVVGRKRFDGTPVPGGGTLPWETGYKDTVVAYPGEVTTVKARFDIAGLYVWHCHIVEHEDNEMMRPYVVSGP